MLTQLLHPHWLPLEWVVLYVAIAWCVRAVMALVILRRDLAPGAAIAWLGIIFLHPYIGLVLYLIVGETRLGPARVARHREAIRRYRPELEKNHDHPATSGSPGTAVDDSYSAMIRQAEKVSGLPIIGGNQIEFISDSSMLIARLIEDIHSARQTVHLLYFTFACDDTANRVAGALRAAGARGVRCRLLVDAVGSRHFLHRDGLSESLRDAGVEIAAALPVAPLQRGLPRMDLRNHRKLAIIDGATAFIGSQNIIDPSYGHKKTGPGGIGPWFDLTMRCTGPLVKQLALVFNEDWAFETRAMLDESPAAAEAGDGVMGQVVPTGPTGPGESFRRVFLAALQCAKKKVVLTTPYFVPDEPTLVAMMMAADRGVEVTLIVPHRADHPFTAAAGRAHYSRLLEAGIRIYQFMPGLIHAKTTTVDDAFAIVGSANLDVRSFNLNFELSVILYGAASTQQVWEIQQVYLKQSVAINEKEWKERGLIKQYVERAFSLLSPLL